MGFQKGNKLVANRRKPKPFLDALNMELKAAGDDHKALRRIAKKLIAEAEKGEMWAVKEIADRLDGKVPQAMIGDKGEDPIMFSAIVRTIVDPAHKDG